jgi:hypothetical protein
VDLVGDEFSAATGLMKSLSFFMNKDDTNTSAPVAMTRVYTLSIACMMASAAAARASGGSLRKIALYGPAMAMESPRLRTISRRGLPTVCGKQCSERR